MIDLAVPVREGAASLAEIARTLGDAGIGIEGGGMWSGVAHYLVADGESALHALATAGIEGAELREVVVAHLDADVPGALGRIMTKLAGAGVHVDAQYSDHDNSKVLLVDRPSAARTALA